MIPQCLFSVIVLAMTHTLHILTKICYESILSVFTKEGDGKVCTSSWKPARVERLMRLCGWRGLALVLELFCRRRLFC